MSEPMSPERLAEIRADDEGAGPWTGGPDEKFHLISQRRELLAHIDHLTAREQRVRAVIDQAERVTLTVCRTYDIRDALDDSS